MRGEPVLRRFYDGEKVTIFVHFQVDASVQNDNMDMVVFDVRWVDDDALHRQRVRLVNPGSQKFILEVNDGLDSERWKCQMCIQPRPTS